MTRKLIAIAILTLSVGAFGCDQNKPADPAGGPAKSTTESTNAAATAAGNVVTPTAVAQPVTIADTDLSTPADFEEDAEKAITAKNYKAQLATLEVDLDKE